MKTLAQLIAEEKQTEKRLRKNKKATNALKKAKRKLRKAIRQDSLQAIQISIGMAQTALSKAKFLTSVL